MASSTSERSACIVRNRILAEQAFLLKNSRGIDPIEGRHRDIHNNDFGPLLLGHFDQTASVAGSSKHIEIPTAEDERDHPATSRDRLPVKRSCDSQLLLLSVAPESSSCYDGNYFRFSRSLYIFADMSHEATVLTSFYVYSPFTI